MLLVAENITFAYADAAVLREVSASLAPAEIVAIIGPNGSGKSTLLKILAGHLRSSGSIRWEARNIWHWSRRELARRIAYLPQTPTHDVDQRVIDVLRLGRAPYWSVFGIESAQDSEIVSRIAQQLELTNLLERRMDELSGGQRQRVFIGRCLVQQPVAMLLDEPSTFLDLRHQVDLLKLLRELAQSQSIGVLLASHDINLAAAFADRMILLSEGQVAASGTPTDVMHPDLMARVYAVEMDRIERGAAHAPVLLPRID